MKDPTTTWPTTKRLKRNAADCMLLSRPKKICRDLQKSTRRKLLKLSLRSKRNLLPKQGWTSWGTSRKKCWTLSPSLSGHTCLTTWCRSLLMVYWTYASVSQLTALTLLQNTCSREVWTCPIPTPQPTELFGIFCLFKLNYYGLYKITLTMFNLQSCSTRAVGLPISKSQVHHHAFII